MRNKLLILLALATLACSRKPVVVIPEAPDYNLPANWYHLDRDAEADLFYICSTCVYEAHKENGALRYNVSVTDANDRDALLQEMNGVDRRLSGETFNFYSPYYRQVTLDSYADSGILSKQIPVAYEDAHAAFEHYIGTENQGRPFILAGFSQGSQMVVELLRSMPDNVYDRMVAAYAIGWHITDEDMEAAKGHIVPAQDSGDTGVTICYNSVKDTSFANFVSTGNKVAINPVNWRTDATPAPFCDSLTVHLDPESKLLLVEGYERTDHAFLPYFEGGNYHTFEIRWYSDYLLQNMQDRLLNFKKHAADIVPGAPLWPADLRSAHNKCEGHLPGKGRKGPKEEKHGSPPIPVPGTWDVAWNNNPGH